MRTLLATSLALPLALTVCTYIQAAPHPWGLTPGVVELKSAGPMAFGPDGILFIGDTAAGAVYAIQTADAKADAANVSVEVKNLSTKLAELLRVDESVVKVNDLAVHPGSGAVYLSIAAGKPAKAAVVRISPDGKLSTISLDAPHSRAVLADAPESKVGRRGDPRDDSITDLAFREGKLLVAGLAKGQSPSTIREFTFPFSENATAMNIEIYHAAHGKLEDHAAVRAFVPLVIDGEPSLLAGFTCTPLVKFPVKPASTGEKVRGTTVAELGNRNRPLDMIAYEKDGKAYLLMANSARGVMKVSLAGVGANPGLTSPVKGGGTAGQPYETISSLQGVVQLDRLDSDHAVVLVQAKDGPLELRTIELP